MYYMNLFFTRILRALMTLSLGVTMLSHGYAESLDLTASLSGDEALKCGSLENGPCPTLGAFDVAGEVLLYLVVFALVVGFLSVMGKSIMFYFKSDKPTIRQLFSKSMGNYFLSLIMFAIIIGLGYTFLSTFIKPEFLNPIKKVLSPFSSSMLLGVPHAYAQEEHIPNHLVVTSVWDLAIVIFQFTMRWVLIPGVIASWVYAGFLFVTAQGNATKIANARQRLWFSFVLTLIFMFALGLAYSLRDTINQIIS